MTQDYELDLANCAGSASVTQALCFILEQEATLNLKIIGVGELFMNLNLEIAFSGEHAQANLTGALYLNHKSQFSITILQHHALPNCESRVQVRTVLDDFAQFNYDGKILIDAQAQNSVANQENKNMVLSKDVSVRSVPNIEVLNTAVTCGHGSAIGELDRDQLVYLASRGVAPACAKQLLIESFLGMVI